MKGGEGRFDSPLNLNSYNFQGVEAMIISDRILTIKFFCFSDLELSCFLTVVTCYCSICVSY